jgi:hypothetical protein
MEEERELFGEDAWPYNIKDNLIVLETMTRYAERVGTVRLELVCIEGSASCGFAGESGGDGSGARVLGAGD